MKTIFTTVLLISMMLIANIAWGDIFYGDVNIDGKVTPTDAALVMQHVVGELTLDSSQQVRGNVTNDGSLSSMDAALILQKITGLISTFPAQTQDMVFIPAGEFSMGDHHGSLPSRCRPVHTVYLDAFYIDQYEVTNAQYATFLNDYGQNKDAEGHELLKIYSDWCLIEKVGDAYQPKAGYENHPVIHVSWYGAAAYAKFYGKRLPTEAEWEKAARGGLVGKKYPWGDDISHDDANYGGIGGKDKWWATSPVGSFAPNNYDLYDMAGNGKEWCADWFDSDYYTNSPKDNPKGPSSGTGRVLRGGSWAYGNASILRCAYRGGNVPTYLSSDYGFRCSQDL